MTSVITWYWLWQTCRYHVGLLNSTVSLVGWQTCRCHCPGGWLLNSTLSWGVGGIDCWTVHCPQGLIAEQYTVLGVDCWTVHCPGGWLLNNTLSGGGGGGNCWTVHLGGGVAEQYTVLGDWLLNSTLSWGGWLLNSTLSWGGGVIAEQYTVLGGGGGGGVIAENYSGGGVFLGHWQAHYIGLSGSLTDTLHWSFWVIDRHTDLSGFMTDTLDWSLRIHNRHITLVFLGSWWTLYKNKTPWWMQNTNDVSVVLSISIAKWSCKFRECFLC